MRVYYSEDGIEQTRDNRNNVFSVSQINEYIKMLIDGDRMLTGIYVTGEISNFKNNIATGHLFFTLKDQDSLIKAVMFNGCAQKLKFVPENGMKVIVHGRISVFPRDGIYQIYVDSMQPDGAGALYFAFEQLKKKLDGEGLFDIGRKKSIPQFPDRIGVVTSPTGAAVQDMINIISRRYPLTEIVVYPAQVQGQSAPRELCRGIEFFNIRLPVDTIIIGRGGGSIEDLWAFNNETLARQIAASKIPVISAVGHETDFTIADFVSDLRAPTPSAAAELAVPDIESIKNCIDSCDRRIKTDILSLLTVKRKMLERAKDSRVLTDPLNIFNEKRMILSYSADRLFIAGNATMEKARSSLAQVASSLGALNPLAVLSRGYSAVFDENGNSISSIDSVRDGDKVDIRLSDGVVHACVNGRKRLKNG